MPLYTVTTRSALSAARKKLVVDLITDTHCQETGAPEVFVQVVFSQGVPLPKDQAAHISGSIRAGRSTQVKAVIHRRLETGVQEIMASQSNVKIELFDIPHTWVMEGGEMMPAPGKEHLAAASIAKFAAELDRQANAAKVNSA